MTINKETKSLGMPWEEEYGYAQSVKGQPFYRIMDHHYDYYYSC